MFEVKPGMVIVGIGHGWRWLILSVAPWPGSFDNLRLCSVRLKRQPGCKPEVYDEMPVSLSRGWREVTPTRYERLAFVKWMMRNAR